MIVVVTTIVLLIVAGILAVSNLIIAKKPQAQELFNRIAPAQGIVGCILAVWGLVQLIYSLVEVGDISDAAKISSRYGKLAAAMGTDLPSAGSLWFYWVMTLVMALMALGLGFLLGYGIIHSRLLSKNKDAADAGEKAASTLQIIQVPLGLAAIIIAVLAAIATLIVGEAGAFFGSLVVLLLVVFVFACLWKLFVKAGIEGWKGIIPIYNMYLVVTDIAGLPVLWFILLFVPVVNILAQVYLWFAVAKRFGQGVGFAIGLILLNPIFVAILAFGPAKYDASADTSLEGVSGGSIKTPDALKNAEQATQGAVSSAANNAEPTTDEAPDKPTDNEEESPQQT
jgi:hypothetical protein